VGLAPPNKAPSPLKLKGKTLQIGGILVNFIMPSPPAEPQSPPIENFLATVLCPGHLLACTGKPDRLQAI